MLELARADPRQSTSSKGNVPEEPWCGLWLCQDQKGIPAGLAGLSNQSVPQLGGGGGGGGGLPPSAETPSWCLVQPQSSPGNLMRATSQFGYHSIAPGICEERLHEHHGQQGASRLALEDL